MKKNIIVLTTSVLVLSLMAFKYLKSNNNESQKLSSFESNDNMMVDLLSGFEITNPEELIYKIDTRFIAKISKSNLDNATSIIDILPKKATAEIENFSSSRISLCEDFVETDIRAYSDNEILTDSQIQLIQSTDETDNIYIRSDYSDLHSLNGDGYSKYLTYFISIVPDQQALYQPDEKPLIQYLKDGSKDAVSIIEKDKLKAGQVRFTITKEGGISDVKLLSSSGYSSVDAVLTRLIENMPGKWKPAANLEGDPVEQDLVFFFGLMGC